ncbi:MAG: hypothetical protein JNL73_19020 [Anaerolineales bacterium]|nr:hypothetical protein [Anaerolineales bacterium]
MKRLTTRQASWVVLSAIALLLVLAAVFTFVEPPRATDFDRLHATATDDALAEATPVMEATGTMVVPEPTVVFRQPLDAFFGAAWSENSEFMALTSRQGDRDLLSVFGSMGDILTTEPIAGLRTAPIFVSSTQVAAYAVHGATPQIMTVDWATHDTSLRDLKGDCRDAAIYPVLSGQPGQLTLVGTSPNRDFTADTTHVFLADLASGACGLWQTYPEIQTASVVGLTDGRLALSLFRRPGTPDDPGHHEVAVFQVGGSAKPTCLIDARANPILWNDREALGVRDPNRNGSVEVWDIVTCSLITRVPIGNAPNYAMAHDATRGWLYVGGTSLVVLDDQTGAELRRVPISERADAWVRSVTMAPDGTRLAVFVAFDQGLAGELVVFALR